MHRLKMSLLATLLAALPALLIAALPASSFAQARTYDAAHPWFAEASVGAVQPGPDGTDFGSGQNFGAHLGAMLNAWSDLSLSVGWAHARSNDLAIDSDVTSGGLRARGFLGANRMRFYGEAGLRAYHFSLQQSGALSETEDSKLRAGGEIGAGVLYVRSTWWAGLGAEVHGAIGSSSLESGNLLTFTTYSLSVGAPLGW